MPQLSILLPIYRKAVYLPEALESVISQSFQNWELIIIIDPPISQKTKEIILNYFKKDKRIKILENQEKLGFPKSLNKGLKIARGKYIARIDDDDIWADKDKLQKQIEFLENNREYFLVGSGAIAIDEASQEIYRFLCPKEDGEIRQYILFRNPFVHSSVIFYKDIALKLKGYDEKVPGVCDYDLWLKIGKIGKFYNLSEYLVKFRIPSIYRDYEKVRRQRISRTLEKIKVIKRYKNDYPHFCEAIFKDYLKLLYLMTLARFSKIDNLLYRTRQTSFWKI